MSNLKTRKFYNQVIMETQQKLRVLFRGWVEIAHSYAIVNCFQLVHLYKNYNDKLDIYIEEMEYFRQEWNNSKKLIYSEEYNNIIRNFKKWNGEDVDVVYSITYPYNVTPVYNKNGKVIPKCVFYTSEFSQLDTHYFSCNGGTFNNNTDLVAHFLKHPEMHFTSPSNWSARGLLRYGVVEKRNYTITHGVDSSIFKLHQDKTKRKQLRNFYKIKDDEILLMNIGAMTQNKGIMLILEALNRLVNRMGYKQFKLLLKGTGDLYTSKSFLETYFQKLKADRVMSNEEVDKLLTEHIIFSDKTVSYERINDMFNAADLYLSPYLAEGFNLVALESISAGLPVLIPETGSTKEFIEDIYRNGGSDYIYYVNSQVAEFQGGLRQNIISVDDIVETIIKKIPSINYSKENRHDSYDIVSQFIKENYSWDAVSTMLYQYLLYISLSQK